MLRYWLERKIMLKKVRHFLFKTSERFFYIYTNTLNRVSLLEDLYKESPDELLKIDGWSSIHRINLNQHSYGKMAILKIDLSMIKLPGACEKGIGYGEEFINLPDLCEVIAILGSYYRRLVIIGYVPTRESINNKQTEIMNQYRNLFFEDDVDLMIESQKECYYRLMFLKEIQTSNFSKDIVKVLNGDAFYAKIMEIHYLKEKELIESNGIMEVSW